MAVRTAINGFGRMGRLALRAAWGCDELDFVHLNEIAGDAECAAHLLNFDSVHGRWEREASAADDRVMVDGSAMSYSQHDTPGPLTGEQGASNW